MTTQDKEAPMKVLTLNALMLRLLATMLAGLLLMVGLSWYVVEKVKVCGPTFQKMSMGKDLLADILPPPAYLLEAYMTSYQ